MSFISRRAARPAKQDPVDAFMRKKAEIDALLARLQSLSDEHFGTAPDDVTWGHVGDLEDYAATLKQLSDRAFREGEYAD